MIRRECRDESTEGLSPLESLDLGGISDFSQLLEAMKDTAFSGRKLGEAYEVLLEMARDEGCDVVLTISGAMTVAKQGTIICDLIDRGIVKAVVATGALIAHGLTESIGLTHYRMEQSHSDGSSIPGASTESMTP
jgi:deoxyhypusine synthase